MSSLGFHEHENGRTSLTCFGGGLEGVGCNADASCLVGFSSCETGVLSFSRTVEACAMCHSATCSTNTKALLKGQRRQRWMMENFSASELTTTPTSSREPMVAAPALLSLFWSRHHLQAIMSLLGMVAFSWTPNCHPSITHNCALRVPKLERLFENPYS